MPSTTRQEGSTPAKEAVKEDVKQLSFRRTVSKTLQAMQPTKEPIENRKVPWWQKGQYT